MRRVTMLVAETARFVGGTQIWCPHTQNSLNLRGRNLGHVSCFLVKSSVR